MRVATALGFFLIVGAVHAQDLPLKPEARNLQGLQTSDGIAISTQEQLTAGTPNSDAMFSDVNAHPLPDKPKPVAREGQWIPRAKIGLKSRMILSWLREKMMVG